MWAERWRMLVICLAVVAAGAGCSADEDDWGPRAGDYTWTGDGPPGNFAADSAVCGRPRVAAPGSFTRDQDPNFAMPTIGGAYATGSPRAYNDCLASRGWKLNGTPQTTAPDSKPPTVW